MENTWYLDKIKEFISLRYSHTEKCQNCFVQRFCNQCFEKVSGKDDAFDSSYHNFCHFNRSYYQIIFQYMLQIMENNPALWDELQAVAEKKNEEQKQKASERNAAQLTAQEPAQ